MSDEHSTASHFAAAPTQHSALRTQHFWVLALTILVALTRFLALSKSVWDWDEGLFLSAMRDYDVVLHHPHPPGFPLFIAAAKLMRLVIGDDFHALRAVSLLASLFVFPALYALGRALGFPFRNAMLAALLFSFLPNVWFWGGTAFSDVFALVLFLFAAALLFGCGVSRSRGLAAADGRAAYFLGSLLFAATLLVRPQNVLMAYPWLLASWRRRWSEVLASAALITLLVLGGYGLAARATGGWDLFIAATKAHQKYVATIDGALNPNRPSPVRLFYDFAVDPFLAGRASIFLSIFAALAFLRPKRRDVDVVLTFAPNLLLAWLTLSVTGGSRLSLGYIPMHALLAADGMAVVAAFLARRREPIARGLEAAFAAAIILRYVYWVWPALAEVRRHDSPPMAVIRWVERNVSPERGKVYLQGGLVPFATYYLTAYTIEPVTDDFDPATALEDPGAVYIADGVNASPRAVNFRRPHRRLWGLFHRRYFEACAVPILGGQQWRPGKIQYAEGWHDAERGADGRPFRWMGERSRTLLESLPQRGRLSADLYAPLDAEPAPAVTITFNGTVLERFRPAAAEFHRAYELDSRPGVPGELVISVDRVVNQARMGLGGDARDLGLRVTGLSWKALMP